jgi:NADH-quinone oxidoreductase subunit J
VIEAVLFWVLAVVAVGGGLGMLLNLRNTVASALFLVLTMLALACLFVLLLAQFVGVIQVMIYAGAIVVLFLFVIMLLNLERDRLGGEVQPVLKTIGTLFAVAVGVKLVAIVSSVRTPWAEVGEEFGTTSFVGQALYTDYLLPFELASILLLTGIIGAIVLAKRSLDS